MSDPLDPVFVDPVEKHATKEEKEKLKKLNKDADALYKMVNNLYSERTTLLKNLPDGHASEKQRRKDGRDMLLRINKLKMQELREERYIVHLEKM